MAVASCGDDKDADAPMCGDCGAVQSVDARFCNQCGAAMPESAQPVGGVAPTPAPTHAMRNASLGQHVEGPGWVPLDPNLATIASDRYVAVALVDPSGIRELAAPDGRMIGRRRKAPHADAGVDRMVRFAEMWIEDGTTEVTSNPIAIRGDRLTAAHCTVRSDGGEIAFLIVAETDEDGLITAQVTFDDDQLHDALDELNRRWAALDPQPRVQADAWIDAKFRHGFDSGDADGWRQLFTPDCMVVDHRRLGLGTRTAAQWVESNRSFAGELDEWVSDIPLMVDHVEVTRMEKVRRDGSGAWSLFNVVSYDDMAVCGMELFDLDQRADAVARFEALSRQ